MVAIERLGEGDLLELSQRTDRLGVLSVYADTDRRQDANLRATAIDLNNRFRELQQRLADDRSDRGRAVTTALDRLRPRLEDLVSPVDSGRSRVLFAALENDWTLSLDSTMPVANRLVLNDGPFIHPLLELLDEGRAAGVVVVSADDARLLEWRLGSLRLLSRLEPGYVEAPHERAGQLGGGPAGQFNTPVREQRQSRAGDSTQRFLRHVVDVVARLAGERGWERILVSGGPQWTEAMVTTFPGQLGDSVSADPRVLAGFDDAALATIVTEWAHDQHADREQQLLLRLPDAAGSGRAAVGVSQVAAALNAGRVYHLVYDPQVRYTGAIGADGALYGDGETGPGGRPTTPEPRLTERLVGRALRTGARVSPVDGAADAELRDANGIAALLRW